MSMISRLEIKSLVLLLEEHEYAEYADVSVKELARNPESFDFVTAASVPTAGLTAWQMIIDEAKVSNGW